MLARVAPGDTTFLAGGGEMGARMRAHDWGASPLGQPERWPQSLRTTVSLLLNSRFPMFVAWGPELGFLYNDDYAEILGTKHPAALGRPFADIWAEIWSDVGPLAERALAGEATFHEDLPLTMLRKGYEEQTYFTFSYSPVRDESGRIGGMFCACTETTAEVTARSSLKAEQERLRDLFHQAPGFMAVLRGRDHVFEITNAAYLQLVGYRDLVGKPVREALPDVAGQGFFELLDRVYKTGEAFVGSRLPVRVQRDDRAPLEERFVDFVYQPITDARGEVAGIFVEGTDVTEAVRSEQALRASEERLRIAQRTGGIGSFELVPSTGMLYPSEQFCRLWWLPVQAEMPVADALARIHPDDRHLVVTDRSNLPANALQYIEYRIVDPESGATRWMARRGEAVEDERGTRYVGVSYDITDRKAAEQALVAETQALEILNRTGSAVAAELDLDGLVNTVTEAGVELTGAAFGAFFYNVVDDQGERYTLYAISGVAREEFSKFPMPRNTHVFAPTFEGTGILRSPDITKDERYGKNDPHFGMPKGHLPVRSYLAVPVASRSGEVLGGLFFGHPNPDVFDERAERLIAGIAGQAATAIDNARLFEAAQRDIAERRRAEEALQELNATLEHQIAERTEQLRRNEEALHHAQKMEAVGQLTGGIAHDFNNLLTGIIGSLDLMQTRMLQGRTGDIDRYAKAAIASANRAAALTHRLLAFSRRQPLDPKPVDANKLVSSIEDLLRRTIGPAITLEFVVAGGLWRTLCDPNQLESAILNLVINARDAMPNGGKLVIETANAHLDDAYVAQQRDVTPGQYVAICVTDTGTGMPPEVIARAFDPFFTTKPIGQGTGLGLSMVYGFAKQSEGHAKIYSEPGRGTTVKIYLPRHRGEEDGDHAVAPAELPKAGAGETVLVVEDEPVVRDIVVEILQDLGYLPLQATDGPSGLKVLQSRRRIDLLVTDVGLPGGINGRQLADFAREHRPELKVLFITGYAENAAIAAGFLEPGMEMITKPFATDALGAKVRAMLRRD
jgi:signal transduction histidine kinase/PAS domain-containing protein/ActR/RegA family two-component response regulator